MCEISRGPEESTAFVIHDEHGDEHLTLGPGVSEFRFLDGSEDEWGKDA